MTGSTFAARLTGGAAGEHDDRVLSVDLWDGACDGFALDGVPVSDAEADRVLRECRSSAAAVVADALYEQDEIARDARYS